MFQIIKSQGVWGPDWTAKNGSFFPNSPIWGSTRPVVCGAPLPIHSICLTACFLSPCVSSWFFVDGVRLFSISLSLYFFFLLIFNYRIIPRAGERSQARNKLDIIQYPVCRSYQPPSCSFYETSPPSGEISANCDAVTAISGPDERPMVGLPVFLVSWSPLPTVLFASAFAGI